MSLEELSVPIHLFQATRRGLMTAGGHRPPLQCSLQVLLEKRHGSGPRILQRFLIGRDVLKQDEGVSRLGVDMRFEELS
jgi:hypothetical protein